MPKHIPSGFPGRATRRPAKSARPARVAPMDTGEGPARRVVAGLARCTGNPWGIALRPAPSGRTQPRGNSGVQNDRKLLWHRALETSTGAASAAGVSWRATLMGAGILPAGAQPPSSSGGELRKNPSQAFAAGFFLRLRRWFSIVWRWRLRFAEMLIEVSIGIRDDLVQAIE